MHDYKYCVAAMIRATLVNTHTHTHTHTHTQLLSYYTIITDSKPRFKNNWKLHACHDFFRGILNITQRNKGRQKVVKAQTRSKNGSKIRNPKNTLKDRTILNHNTATDHWVHLQRAHASSFRSHLCVWPIVHRQPFGTFYSESTLFQLKNTHLRFLIYLLGEW